MFRLLGGGNGVQPCSNAGPGNFCCYGLSNADCCSNSTLVFDLGVGTIVSVTSMTSTTMTSTITESTASTTSSAPSVTSSAPAATSLAAASTNNSVAIGVGAGVGIPVGLALIAAVFYFLVWKPKQKRKWMEGANHGSGPAGENAGAGYGQGYKRPVYEPNYRGAGYVPVSKEGGIHEMQGLRGTELPAEGVDDAQRGPAELG